MSTEQLKRTVELLVNQVGHWTPERWRDRGEPLHHLVQSFADQAADLAGAPRRPVPRLSDLALPDQLRVVTGDLIAAGPTAAQAVTASDEIAALRRTLA